MLLATLVASTSFGAVAASRPAGADQVSTLQAQAVAISQQLIQEQLQVDADHQQYSVVSARVAADAQAITQIGQQIGQDQRADRRPGDAGPPAGRPLLHGLRNRLGERHERPVRR